MSPRVIIKAAIHVFGQKPPVVAAVLHVAAHRIIFFGIKSVRIAFESSESRPLMFLDNVMRSLNKIHLSLPLLVIGIPLVAGLVAPFRSPLQLLVYRMFRTSCWSANGNCRRLEANSCDPRQRASHWEEQHLPVLIGRRQYAIRAGWGYVGLWR